MKHEPKTNPEVTRVNNFFRFFFFQINFTSFNTYKNSKALAELLFEVTSEKQLSTILSSNRFNIRHLHKFIDFSFEYMEKTFKHDCMQFNPHLNYLKIPLLLKHSMLTLMDHIRNLRNATSVDSDGETHKLTLDPENYKSIVKGLISFLEHIDRLEHTCLAFIELRLIENYLKKNFLKEEMFGVLIKFGTICMLYATNVLQLENIMRYDIEISLKCVDLLLKQKLLWNVINNSDKFVEHLELFVNVLYDIVNFNFGNAKLMSKFEIESLNINGANDCDKKAIFLSKFVEVRSNEEHRKDYFKLEVGLGRRIWNL